MVRMLQCESREAWLKQRTGYIGGSEAACIIGMNPYQSNVDLWEIKTGRKKPENISSVPSVKYGTEAESLLRELFKLDYPQYKVDYCENNMWLNSDYPFAHASLDGWITDKTGRRGIWECKTTTIQSPSQKMKWENRIPDNYYCQVLWYLAVTGFDFAVLKAQLRWLYDDDVLCVTKHYHIERVDVEDDIQMLMDAARKFAEYITTDTRPPLVLPNFV